MALKLEIKARNIIKPAGKTWTGTMKVSEKDMVSSKVYMPKVYLYKPNKDWDSNSISQTLKESLAKVLVHFYPFAGRFRHIGGGRVELVVDDTADTWGVELVEAEADVAVADFGDDLLEAEVNGKLNTLFSIIESSNYPIEELPLLAVLITHFRCGGVAVGITWSHGVVDGIGAGHFYTAWTRIARGESMGIEPVHERSLLRAGEPPRPVSEFIQQNAPPPPPYPVALTPTDKSKVDTPPLLRPFPGTSTLKLLVSRSQIEKLKQIAGDVTNGRPYSRYEVLTAHVWRCACKARGHKGKKVNACGIPINIRERINPPLPQAFNGNGIFVITATSESEDLISKPLGYACDKIRQTIDKVNSELVWAFFDYQKSVKDLWTWQGMMTPEGAFVTPHLLLPNWMNLSFNNLDFGWGNEAHMASVRRLWDGEGSIRNGHDGTSSVVVICLQDAHVDKFKEYFFHEFE